MGARMCANIQMETLVRTLEHMGVEFEQREGGVVAFCSNGSECVVFQSRAHDGKLFVRYEGSALVDTAADAMVMCGLLSDGAE